MMKLQRAAFPTGVLATGMLVLLSRPVFGVESFVVVEKDRPACSIVTAEDPTPAARLAALELQHHFLQSSGVEIGRAHV